jgi:hypothetical protein
VVNADRSSVTVEPIKPSVSADLAQDILSETATNALIESVWGSASGQLRQIIQMGKVTREQVDILSRDLTILAMGLTGNKPGVNESKTTSFVKNMHAEPPFVIQKSALLDEPIKKQHQYDEATFGCQQRLIRSLRKAKAEDSTQVIQFLESIKHQ